MIPIFFFQVATTCSCCSRFFCLKHVLLVCSDCEQLGRPQMPAAPCGPRVRIPAPRLIVSPQPARARRTASCPRMPAPALAAPAPALGAPTFGAPTVGSPAVCVPGSGVPAPFGQQIVLQLPPWPQGQQQQQPIQFMLPPLQFTTSPQEAAASPQEAAASSQEAAGVDMPTPIVQRVPVARRSIFASIGNLGHTPTSTSRNQTSSVQLQRSKELDWKTGQQSSDTPKRRFAVTHAAPEQQKVGQPRSHYSEKYRYKVYSVFYIPVPGFLA